MNPSKSEFAQQQQGRASRSTDCIWSWRITVVNIRLADEFGCNSSSSSSSRGWRIQSRSLLLFFLFVSFILSSSILLHPVDALGSMSSIAAIYNNGNTNNANQITVCGVLPGASQTISCWESSANTTNQILLGNATFISLGGGSGFFCGLRQWSMQPFCWSGPNFAQARRLSSNRYSQIAVGDAHLCGIRAADGAVDCWRSNSTGQASPPPNLSFLNITSGSDFSCGIVASNQTVICWGNIEQQEFQPNASAFWSIEAGKRHACGLYSTFRSTYCWGDNAYGQKNFPEGVEFAAFALGERHSCGLLKEARQALCWGDNSSMQLAVPKNTSFDSITAGDFFTCGVRSGDFLVICWGKGFSSSGRSLPLRSLPGRCTEDQCPTERYALVNATGIIESSSICGSSARHVCVYCSKCPEGAFEARPCGGSNNRECSPLSSNAPSPAPQMPRNNGTRKKKGLSRIEIVSLVLGSTGALIGVVSLACCAWMKLCCCKREKDCRIHHSANANNGSVTISQQQQLRRQRSGASTARSRSSVGRADAFTLEELAAATDGFSEDNKIGNGSFGSVYRGVLPDGREVAIKRGSAAAATGIDAKKRFQDKETAFQSELEFLTRLHHRHLVTLVGFCAEDDERLLVYDFMPNGTVHDHLHGISASASDSAALNSWQMRISIALQAARGIEYLHTYAVPPIIHRDIKSSNILLDSEWSARVSDFGLSLMGPSEGVSHLSMTAAGTLGYMDPEYYRLQHLTTKSDVYSFGVVLLELLTGKRAIIVHKQQHKEQQHKEQQQVPVNVVDFAVPFILARDVGAVLDPRLRPPEVAAEMEAVSMVAELAEQCVRLEGRERPSMGEIVTRLESAAGSLSQASLELVEKKKNGRSDSSSSGEIVVDR